MKKVLLATTALAFSAGYAAAQEVSLSGSAELGVVGGDDDDLGFHTDIDVTFTMAGETDTGLTFGANIDLDESDIDREITIDTDEDNRVDLEGSGAFANETQGGESIFISGAFGTLTMGDTDGALDWALQEAIIGSALNDDHEHGGYNGNAALDGRYDGQIARYEYAFADFAIAASAEIDDGEEADPVLGIGARYATEFNGVGLGFGIGYQTITNLEDAFDDVRTEVGDIIDPDDDDDDEEDVDLDVDAIGVSADITFAGFQVILNYSDYADLGQHVGAAVGYTFDAWTFAANWGEFSDVPAITTEAVRDEDGDIIGFDDVIDVGNLSDTSGYGLIVNYDLGGGAELQAGYGVTDPEDGDTEETYSFGVAMSF